MHVYVIHAGGTQTVLAVVMEIVERRHQGVSWKGSRLISHAHPPLELFLVVLYINSAERSTHTGDDTSSFQLILKLDYLKPFFQS